MFLFVETKIKHYICIVKQTLKVMATINETIAAVIADSINDNHGSFSLEVEMDGNTVVEVSGRYEIDGYREDDYLNGTGAWVTTRAAVSVECIEAYDEDGEAVEIDCSLNEIERYVENELAA